MQHIVTVEGRCLIRTFLAGATKDAEVCLVSKEQAQNKKLRLDLVLSERMITFAPDNESLKWLVALSRAFFDNCFYFITMIVCKVF